MLLGDSRDELAGFRECTMRVKRNRFLISKMQRFFGNIFPCNARSLSDLATCSQSLRGEGNCWEKAGFLDSERMPVIIPSSMRVRIENDCLNVEKVSLQ